MAAIGDKSHPIFIDACGQAQVCDSIAGGGGSTVVGSIVPYCGTDTPDGFFPCDGREISRESYADLYAVIGNTFGDPTDPTKFKLPKIDDARYLQGNTTPGQEKSEELPNITGSYESQTDYEITAADSITTSGALSETAKRNLTIVQPVTTIQLSTSGIKLDASKMSGSVYKDGGAVQPKSVTVRYLICWKKTIAKVDAVTAFPDWNLSSRITILNCCSHNDEEHPTESGYTTSWQDVSYTAPESGFIYGCVDALFGSTTGIVQDAICRSFINNVCCWNIGIGDSYTGGRSAKWFKDVCIPVQTGDVFKVIAENTTQLHANFTRLWFIPAKATPAKLTELYMGTPDWDNVVGLKPHYTTEPYRFTITKDGWLEVGFYDPDNTMPDNSVKEWAVTVNGQSASWHSVGKTAGAYNTDAQLTMVPVASGDIAELILPAAGAANDGRYYAIVYFVPRKKIQIDASDITATGACGVPNYDAYDSTKHDIAFDTIVTKAASGYGNITNRAGKNCFVATEDCFVFPGCYAVNAGNPDAIGIFVGESNSSTYMFRYSCQDITTGDQVHYTAVPLKKGQIVTVLCADADSSLSGKCYWLPMQSLAPQIAMPDYSQTSSSVESGFVAPSNGWIFGNTTYLVSGTTNVTCYVNGKVVYTSLDDKESGPFSIPVTKGDVFTCTDNGIRHGLFYPCKIVQQTNDAPYVVERKHGTNTDGSTWWYTLWSDKWCEQGGLCKTYNSGSTDYELTLQKAYADTDYTVTATPRNTMSTPRQISDRIDVLIASASSVIFLTWNVDVGGALSTNPQPVFWRAEGYVA